MNNYDYPIGSDTKNAPWNKEENPEKEIEVLVSLTLSKSIKIKIDDYDETIEKDEDGKYSIIDYSNCNLINAVKDQVYLPYEAGQLFNICLEEKQLPTIDKINDLSNWNIDDFEVVIE